MRGRNTSGGVHRLLATRAAAAFGRAVVVVRFLGVGVLATAICGTGGGRPWMHWDLGRSQKSQ